jgi:hypothetical protein
MGTIKWGRPVENRYGNMVYTSKDGRFTIEKRKFVLPYASIGYLLEGPGVPKYGRDHDTLRDAKDMAQAVANGEI